MTSNGGWAHSERMRKTVLAVAALCVLAACTPEQQQAVINDYARAVTQQGSERAPSWYVDADCNGAHIVLTGWTHVTDVTPSTGATYAIVGLGAMNTGIPLDGTGSADIYVPLDAGSSSPGWPWSLTINGDPGLQKTGTADC